MEKIKVLRIITRLNIGGPALHAALLTREFNGGNFESLLLSGSVSGGEGDMGYIAQSYGVKPLCVNSMRKEINPFLDLIAFFSILKHINKYKPHIVHTHTAKAGTLGRLAAILANVPVRVHTFHGNVFSGYFVESLNNFFISIERILARFTDSIIAISEKQKEEIANVYKITSSEKCRIIKLGFDLEKFLAVREGGAFRKKYNFKEEDILIGIVGRLTRIKNHRMFIDAADYALKNAPADLAGKIKFVVIGDGELRKELAAYTKDKKLENSVFFTGWITDMVDVYAGLDMVALTSLNEGTPVALIEAMASFRPVISTDVGAVKDAVGKAGLLVKSGDYADLAKNILELASSSDRRRTLGEMGRNYVKDMYGKDRLFKDLENLYVELLSKKKRNIL